MKDNLDFKFTDAKKFSFVKSCHFFRFVFLIILFFFNFSKAQEKGEPISIVVGKGATLYSSDEQFNQQIADKKVVLQNADHHSETNAQNKTVLIATSKNSDGRQNLAQEVKIAEDKKRKDAIRQIKDKIDQYAAKTRTEDLKDYKEVPSSSQFSSSYATSKSYINPTSNANDFSKIHHQLHDYSVKRALDHLHTQGFTFYNNKSLDYCYSQVYSVRPPPVLV